MSYLIERGFKKTFKYGANKNLINWKKLSKGENMLLTRSKN